MVLNGNITGSGFSHVPGGVEYQNRSAFSYHYYCASFVPSWTTEPVWTRAICDDVVGNMVFESVDKDVDRTGGASMMTEFGDCFPGDNVTVTEECNRVMNKADTRYDSFVDWTHAQDDIFNPGDVWVDYFSRTYP